MTRHPIEILWRTVGLPEYFLGNDGTNTKLYALYDAIRAQKPRVRAKMGRQTVNAYGLKVFDRSDSWLQRNPTHW